MVLIYWASDSDGKPELHEVETAAELWDFVQTHRAPDPIPDLEWLLELSAGTYKDGSPFLTLTWVATKGEL